MITQSRYIKTGYVTTIEKDLEHHGKWWHPTDPKYKVNGIVKISPSKGIVLDLFSKIEYDFLEKEFVSYEIINGETREGGLITLYNAHEVLKKHHYKKVRFIRFLNAKHYSGVTISKQNLK